MLFYDHSGIKTYQGHVMEELKSMGDESIHMVCTSPPYW